jgi:hypothetical protein
MPSMLKNKEFWYGAAALYLLLKFGDKIPVAGPYVAKLKA